MPVDYAKKLASQLMKDSPDQSVAVDIPNGGEFLDRVVKELQRLGYRVERHAQRSNRVTIYRDGKP